MNQLKIELKEVVALLLKKKKHGVKEEIELNEIDMGLLCYVFKEQITRFMKTKKLTKSSKKLIEDEEDIDSERDEFEILDEEEKDEIDPDEFAQNNMEALSDFVPSEEDDNES